MQRKFIEIMLHHENQNKLLVYFIVDSIALLSKNKHFDTLVRSKQWTYNSYNSKKRRCMSYRNKKLEIIMIITSSNLIFPLHLKKLQRMGLFVNIYIC